LLEIRDFPSQPCDWFGFDIFFKYTSRAQTMSIGFMNTLFLPEKYLLASRLFFADISAMGLTTYFFEIFM
jgi:hypothetical protein